MTWKKGGVPVLVAELKPFFNWQSSISRQISHVFNVRVHEGALNDAIKYAQKGCAMQLWGITLSWKGVCKNILGRFGHRDFSPKKFVLPFLHKMLIAKVSQTFCGWFRGVFPSLFCLTSQTIQCDASHCCECMHCLLTLTFLKPCICIL